jgi:hypothetical protein
MPATVTTPQTDRRSSWRALAGAILRRGWFPAAIVFLYLYSFPYFEGIHSANELPRIYQTMAIVDRHAINIDPEIDRYGGTPDTAGYKGKLFPNKAPGMSFLTIPVYIVEKWASGGRVPELIRMFFWFRLFGSIVPSLLFLLLFWRVLGELVPSVSTRRTVLASYALGTMALTYGTLLIAHQLSGLLSATGYFLLFLARRGGERTGRRAYLAGLAAGAGVLVDYQVAFIGPPLFAYSLLVRPRARSGLLFALGAAGPLAVLLFYQWAAFDSPFRTGYHFPTTALFIEWHSQGFIGLKGFSRIAFWGSLFRADNGLFYFSPFLLLAFVGFVPMLREKRLRTDGIFCLVLVLFFIYFVSAITFWRSGWAVGPRYITCALPYFVAPIAVLLARLDERSWTSRAVPLGLMIVSMVIYLTSNAVFPHYPENFSDPWFDLTLRFGRAGYLPYNLGWRLGLKGLASAVPYLVVGGALLAALLLGGAASPRQRTAVFASSLIVALLVFSFYRAQLRYRHLPVPVGFLPWMERIWEPRHPRMDLRRLLPVGDPKTCGLRTQR